MGTLPLWRLSRSAPARIAERQLAAYQKKGLSAKKRKKERKNALRGGMVEKDDRSK
tara:strand:- start:619 stop:786 length:168 start_codon:yes stop_codon:yes gene_type:complete